MKSALFFAAFLVASVVTIDVSKEFEEFKKTYGKIYKTKAEEEFRKNIFKNTLDRIKNHKEKYDKGEVSYTLGITKLADILPHEVPKGLSLKNSKMASNTALFSFNNFDQLPAEVDWTKKGAVTPVKDQHFCGCCWAFSATGALEGAWFRKTGQLLSLSEQNLVDCSGKYENQGCCGGLPINAFKYIQENGGIDTEESYPFEEKLDFCQYNVSNSKVTISSAVEIPIGDEQSLMAAVATKGPISVCIDASDYNFQLIQNVHEIYFNPHCKSHRLDLDHAVLVVGYGRDEQTGEDYWLVKNSWGSSWGNQGYIKMARNRNNHCGIATLASYPVV